MKILFVIVITALTTFGALAQSKFAFVSSPQSWIGYGRNMTVSTEDGYSFGAGKVYESYNAIGFSIGGPGGWWGIMFDAPNGGFLKEGNTYENATRYPFSRPGVGLNFNTTGRENNDLTGSFTVHEIEYGPNGSVLKAAIDFTQYDEGIASWWNVGQLRYNSSFPVTVPEPGTMALAGLGLCMTVAILRRRKSSSPQ
jgi:hypothetical protein